MRRISYKISIGLYILLVIPLFLFISNVNYHFLIIYASFGFWILGYVISVVVHKYNILGIDYQYDLKREKIIRKHLETHIDSLEAKLKKYKKKPGRKKK